MNAILVSIDPGCSGGVAVWTVPGVVRAFKMPETCKDLDNLINDVMGNGCNGKRCYVEEVSGFAGSGQPGSAMFQFGRGFGNIEGILTARGIPFELVKPQAWQKALGLGKSDRVQIPATASAEERRLLSNSNSRAKRDWKGKLRERAQRLYPQLKVTLYNADALLLLEYARLRENASSAVPAPCPESSLLAFGQAVMDGNCER